MEIEKIKEVEILQGNLSDSINKIIDIKSKIWVAFLESPVEQEIIEKLFRAENDQRKVILDIYH